MASTSRKVLVDNEIDELLAADSKEGKKPCTGAVIAMLDYVLTSAIRNTTPN
jgi:hypothetical protein